MGVLRAMRGEFDTARELFRRGARALEELGLEHERAVEGELGGEIELLAGDPAAAERELDLDRLRMTGVKFHLSDRAAMVAEAVYLQGRYEGAERLTEMSEREAWPEDLSVEVLWRSVRAKALARRGAFEQAERFGREAVALAEKTDSIDQLQAGTRMDLAEVLLLAGRAGEAVPLVRESVELYERKENAVKAARARALLTELAANGAPAATHLGVGSTRQADPRR
jgi:tetratricopeptide (TPR) repeat protein